MTRLRPGRTQRVLLRAVACGGLAFGGAASAAAQAAVPPEPGPGARAAALRARVDVLAADSLGGRETGTEGARVAAAYLAAEARAMGLLPAGDSGGFFQRVPLERRRVEASVTVTTPRGTVRLAPDEVVPLFFGFVPRRYRAEGGGELYYGGDLQDRSTLDPLLGEPERLVGRVPFFRTRPAAVADADSVLPPVFNVASLMSPRRGTAAVVFIAEGRLLQQMTWRGDQARRGQLGPPFERREQNAPPVFLVTPGAMERVLGRPLGGDRQPGPEPGALHYRVRDTVDAVDGAEVVAILSGSDPALRGEYVVLGAHYDHLGTGAAVAGDSIYNGADDNASGVAALLEVAARFAALPPDQRPSRSLLFVWHTAEENGLYGSAAFTEHPPVPRDSIIAYINLDMVARNDPDSLFVVGARRLSTGLGVAVEAANARQPRPFVLDYSLDAARHPQNSYCRSDHVNFARYGIPVVFLTTSHHPEYHTPADDAETLDYDKLARVASLTGDLAADLANLPARPVVDQPVPRPGTACRQ